MTQIELPAEYGGFVESLKSRIRSAQLKAALTVNRELLALYWNIGRALVEAQEQQGWGTRVIERLADDLQKEFRGVSGFSRTNIYRMRSFYLAYVSETSGTDAHPSAIVPQVVGQMAEALPSSVADLPWGHHAMLLEKVKDPVARAWYAKTAVAHGWSRAVLSAQIDTRLFDREGKAITNFQQTLPPVQSDLARQTLKDPYVFDFLTLAREGGQRRRLRRRAGVVRSHLVRGRPPAAPEDHRREEFGPHDRDRVGRLRELALVSPARVAVIVKRWRDQPRNVRGLGHRDLAQHRRGNARDAWLCEVAFDLLAEHDASLREHPQEEP